MTTSELPQQWRSVGSDACAWFATPSLSAGAELVARLAEGGLGQDVEVRSEGVRVRMPISGPEPSEDELDRLRFVSTAAAELALTPDPSAVQAVRLLVDSPDPAAITPFWRAACGYALGAPGLADPLRRQPAVSFRPSREARPLRQRIHVDSVRPADAVEQVRTAIGQEPFGAYGVALADADGNEIDVVPGDALPGEDTADWQVVFGAMAFYPVSSWQQGRALVAAAADLAEAAGTSLMIDARPEGVVLDSGKDLWEGDDEGAAFAGLAARIQTAAHDLGLAAASSSLQFVQLGIDAVDVPAVRGFWANALAYRLDERPWVTDIYDPRRHDPVIFFQEMAPEDEARLRQRNRTVVEVVLPYDQIRPRTEAAVSAGGRVLTEDEGRCAIADPEGNEIVITGSAG